MWIISVAATLLVMVLHTAAWADKIIMKDGTVYTGKILMDSDTAILIGNPPFDPTTYLLETADIDTIVYQEYKLSPPAERRRGLLLEVRTSGSVFSSDELSLRPAPGLYAGGGFRVHPAVEINGGLTWIPAAASGDGLRIDLTDNATVVASRRYRKFYAWGGLASGRLYPFLKKKWRTEPYATLGWQWGHLVPKASGDSFRGSGWLAGVGAHRPLTTHLFLDTRFLYQSLTFDTITFLGQEGTIRPEINLHLYTLDVGLAWRF